MTTVDKKHLRPIATVMAGTQFSVQIGADYANHYIHIDPHTSILRDSTVHVWLCCHHTSDQNFVNRSEFYQDFLIPQSLRYGLFALIDDNENSFTTFASMRAVNMQPFNPENQMAAQRFSGHLQRHTQDLHTNP